MIAYTIGVTAAAAAGFLAAWIIATKHTRQIILNSYAVSAYKIPVPGKCTRCGSQLKKSAVMFVRKFPGPGQLFCEGCFNNGLKQTMHKSSIYGAL